MRRKRDPGLQILLLVVVCALGLGSRRFGESLPDFVAAYAGDTLWALAAFLGIGLVLPRASTARVGLLAMGVSVGVELSQLYHAPWIDSIRGTTLGGLLLGFGFLWSDLACYGAGVGLGVVIESVTGRTMGRRAFPGRPPFLTKGELRQWMTWPGCLTIR